MMMRTALVVLAICLATTVLASSSVAPEKELARHLLASYAELGIAGRPVKAATDTVKVSISLALQSILKMDKNLLTISSWIMMKWNDPFLTWSPEQFGGVNSIALPPTCIWKPDIVNFNDVHHNQLADRLDSMNTAAALVSSNGTVLWVPRVNLEAMCDGYDEQTGQMNCEFIFGSWVHDASLIRIDFENGTADFDMKAYKPSPFVDIVQHSADKKYNTYECCPDYAVITYRLSVKKASSTSPSSPSSSSKCSSKLLEILISSILTYFLTAVVGN